jgi:hypothetical protein
MGWLVRICAGALLLYGSAIVGAMLERSEQRRKDPR